MQAGSSRATSLALVVLAAGCATPLTDHAALTPIVAEEPPQSAGLEGEARGFPALRTLQGGKLADGEFTQWLDGDRLHMRIRYDFGPGRWVEESSVIRQIPSLVQERWSWMEVRGGEVQRKFEIDFLSGDAKSEKLAKNERQRWSAHVDVEPGKSFAGAGWALAIKSVRQRLLRGEAIRFQTVGFTPAPQAATVEITHDGVDLLEMSGRSLAGDRFRIHAQVPWLVRAFVSVPDSRIWLASTPPAAFLRWEGPLAEPSDALVRVDLLPGEPSGAATPRTP